MSNTPESPLANLAVAVTTLAFWRFVAAIISGLLLSAAFPPLCWDILAWVALVPLLFVPQPRSWKQRCLVGYLFGYVHFATCLHWLNEVGFGAGYLLALYCALYPMIWYCFISSLLLHLKDLKAKNLPGESFLYIVSPIRLLIVALAGACCWTALEWLRGTLFTGIPWDLLGVSQYRRTGLIQLASYTGVYGISFLMTFTNLALTIELTICAWMFLARRRHPFPWHFLALALMLIPVCICANIPHALPSQTTPTIDVLAVQGNLPMMRVWDEKIFEQAWETYTRLTTESYNAIAEKPDIIVWPESAIPAPLNYDGYRTMRNAFMQHFDSQFLIGAIHQRYNPSDPQNPNIFNSAFLLDRKAPAAKKLFNPADEIVDYYDKVHRVPFGEYTPGASIFPWLPGLIGMGRDLTPGKSFHNLTVKKDAKIGVNICFEDAFSEPSREFTLGGAQILMTITDDAWYNQSSGAHQHMTHVVFRAVENRRPLLRCGSNSHTCYISPNGVISPLLRDDANDSDFIAAAQVYELPIHQSLGTTFYTQHGDVFARLMLLATMIALVWMTHRTLQQRKLLLAIVTEQLKNKMAKQATETVTSSENNSK
ncbi:MAG: apolipoprotein N-acyltransferase [Victivallales bacterium]|nr:apolipoprotein N-acyltransferase [Victivallales bacterium]